jgi:V/A-type H+-transporting ATPase subunit A
MKLKDTLLRGKEAHDQINILGDDGVPLEYHVAFNKAELIDFVVLQQDAFDKIDASTPLARQLYMVNKLLSICEGQFGFDNFDEVSGYFKKLINLFKQMNYKEFRSAAFTSLEREIEALVAQRLTGEQEPQTARAAS